MFVYHLPDWFSPHDPSDSADNRRRQPDDWSIGLGDYPGIDRVSGEW
jgi:predicted RNase H-like HicB family nuclease